MSFRRRGNSVWGIVVGPVILGVALLCLWANEGRFDYHAAAVRARVLAEPSQARSSEAIAYTGSLKPVSFSGDYVAEFNDYLVVYRTAEIYCWDKKRRDGRDVWDLEWRPSIARNDRNSGLSQALSSDTLKPEAYQLGALEISPSDLHFSDGKERLSPSSLPLSEKGKTSGLKVYNQYFYLRNHTDGGDQLGDERIQYRAVPASATASYFGAIADGVGQGKVFEQKSGFISRVIRDDGTLHHLVNGVRETALMTMKGHIQRLRWMIRGGGTLLAIAGVSITLSMLLHLFMGVPLLGRLIEAGIKLASVVIGGSLAVLTIVTSWFFHHPIFALLVIGGLISIGVWLSKRQKSSQANAGKVMNQLEAKQLPSSNESGQSALGRAEHVFQHLVKIAVSDGKLDETENAFLADWARARSIPDGRIVELFEKAKKDDEVDPLSGTREDLFYLISLALADGYLSPKELKHIRRFGQDLRIYGQELESIILNIRGGKFESNAA